VVRDVGSARELERDAVMETLGASHPSLWMHDNLLEQQSLQQRSFPQPPVDRFAGLVSKERMHSEVVSLGHNGSALGLRTEVPCAAPSHTTPLTAAPDFRCPFCLSWIMFRGICMVSRYRPSFHLF
jgi:hypothetical protein